MPKVSIVMPTRNRPHLLKTALASALRQIYQDIEVVVSDNYCNNEETKKVCESFDSPRLRYVRTAELLPMPDSWEFALSHARGEYVTILSDDSYLFADTITRAMAALGEFGTELVAWNECAYFAPDWVVPSRQNCFFVNKLSFESRLVSSEQVLKKLFNDLFDLDLNAPRFLNSLCHRSLVERVTGVQGRMFLPPSPDYSAAASLLASVKNYVFIDRPLMIHGVTPVSIGASATFDFGKAIKDFFNEFRGATSFTKLLDLDLPTVAVGVAQSLQNAKNYYPRGIPYTINKKSLICSSIAGLVRLERNGANVSEAWRILEGYLSRQPPELRKIAARQRIRAEIHCKMSAIVHRVPGWRYIDQLRGRYVFRGADWSFANLRECGEVAPELVKKVASRTQSNH